MKELEVKNKKKRVGGGVKNVIPDVVPVASTSKLPVVIEEVLVKDRDEVREIIEKEIQIVPEILMNYNERGLPVANLTLYHELSCRQWIIGLVSTCLLASFFSYFQWSSAVPISIIGIGCFLTRRSVETIKFDFIYNTERNRINHHYVRKGIESSKEEEEKEKVEWLNTFISAVWPILDAEIFVAGVDLLEDSLKELAPGIVRTVRISSFSQGSNPIQLLSIRRLPESEDIVIPPSLVIHSEPASPLSRVPQYHPADPGPSIPSHLEEPGTYLNLEVEFVYKRLSRKKVEIGEEETEGKKDNMHFIVYLGVGVKKLVKIELPVSVELAGLTGKLRLRLQVISEPPFVRHVKFCFPTLPIMEIRARPLKSFNIMTLPLISTYILNSVNSVLQNFVAPESYTIDLSRFFLGSDVVMKTKSIGVVCLVIHQAKKLNDGKSGVVDPFVKVSLAHIGKTIATTRVLSNERNPVWEEMFFLQVTSEDFEDNDKIRLTILDYDPTASNDVLGYVELPLNLLKDHPGNYESRSDQLHTSVRGTLLHGSIRYEAAFFPLAKTIPNFTVMDHSHDLDPILNSNNSNNSTPNNSTTNLHSTATTTQRKMEKSRSTFAERSLLHDSPSSEYAARMREMLDGRLPPNPLQRSGILAFQVHQVTELELDSIATTMKYQHQHYHQHGHQQVKDKYLPSTYCNIFVNDEKVFTTRIKTLSNAPYFNVGSENFLRDWTTSLVNFVVLNSRESGEDEIIGFISLELKDLFALRSQVTRWFELTSINGHGKIRLSLLLKPVDIEIPPALRTWNVGSLEITSARISDLKEEFKGKLLISFDNGLVISTPEATSTTSPIFDTRCLRRNEIDFSFLFGPLQIPTISRHSSPISFQLQSSSSGSKRLKVGSAILWPSEVVNSINESTHFLKILSSEFEPHNHVRDPESLPLPTLLHPLRRRPKSHYDSHSPFDTPLQSPTLIQTSTAKSDTVIGTLEISTRWISGIDQSFRELLNTSPGVQDAFKLWEARQIVSRSETIDESFIVVGKEEDHQEILKAVDFATNNEKTGMNSSGGTSSESSRRPSFDDLNTARSHFSSPEEGLSEAEDVEITKRRNWKGAAGSIKSFVNGLKTVKDSRSRYDK